MAERIKSLELRPMSEPEYVHMFANFPDKELRRVALGILRTLAKRSIDKVALLADVTKIIDPMAGTDDIEFVPAKRCGSRRKHQAA